MDDHRAGHGAGIHRTLVGIDVEPAGEHADIGHLVLARLREFPLGLEGGEGPDCLLLGGRGGGQAAKCGQQQGGGKERQAACGVHLSIPPVRLQLSNRM